MEINAKKNFVFSGVNVFSGTSPTTWTDLDLSGITSAINCIVMLEFESSGNAGKTKVRANPGEVIESSSGITVVADLIIGETAFVIVKANLGKVEWRTTIAVVVDIYLTCFWKP